MEEFSENDFLRFIFYRSSRKLIVTVMHNCRLMVKGL